MIESEFIESITTHSFSEESDVMSDRTKRDDDEMLNKTKMSDEGMLNKTKVKEEKLSKTKVSPK